MPSPTTNPDTFNTRRTLEVGGKTYSLSTA